MAVNSTRANFAPELKRPFIGVTGSFTGRSFARTYSDQAENTLNFDAAIFKIASRTVQRALNVRRSSPIHRYADARHRGSEHREATTTRRPRER